jgi:hypothetical protein
MDNILVCGEVTVTLGDADYRKFPYKNCYRKLPKQRRYLSPVTGSVSEGFLCAVRDGQIAS